MSIANKHTNTFFTFPDINECASSPCGSNGRCINQENKFVCTCNPGYTGQKCLIGKYTKKENFIAELEPMFGNFLSRWELIYNDLKVIH